MRLNSGLEGSLRVLGWRNLSSIWDRSEEGPSTAFMNQVMSGSGSGLRSRVTCQPGPVELLWSTKAVCKISCRRKVKQRQIISLA